MSRRSRLGRNNAWVWLIACAGAAAAAEGCSGGFSACEDSKTCPPSLSASGSAGASGSNDASSAAGKGQAGASDSSSGESANDAGLGIGGSADTGTDATSEAGALGETGIAPATGCKRAEDCDDHLACDGIESCVGGACVPGTPACATANPDPAHCDVVCTETPGAPTCSVQGQDKDHDTYLSKLCTASSKPALDCDDNAATTHPGAPELCDGIDNNCNGLIDLADGLTVSGTSQQIGTTTSTLRGAPAIAWATDSSVYGVVWTDGLSPTSGDILFETFDQSGTLKVLPKAINQVKTTSSLGLGLAFGADSFGVAWFTSPTVATYFSTITSAGVPLLSPLKVADTFQFLSPPKVARPSAAGSLWGIVWGTVGGGGTAPNEVLGVELTGIGQFAVSQTTVLLGSSAGIAGTASNYVVVADLAGSARGNAGLTYTGTPSITLTGSHPVVGSGSNGYAIAVSPSGTGSPQFYAYGATGLPVCGPVSIGDASFVPAAVVATPTGYLVASSGVVRVQEVRANCTLGALFTVDAGPGATNVGIAGSASGYGVVWQDPTTGAPKRHLFGPRFCN
jgi:Putative metal-binding motif